LTEVDSIGILLLAVKHFMKNHNHVNDDTVTIAAATEDVCGECPVWDAGQAALYWTDCVGLCVHRLDWASQKHEVISRGVEVYGFRRNLGGGFVVTNTGGAWTWDGAGDLELIAREAEGQRLQLNDCTADSRGRLLTASFFYDPAAKYELGRLIRIDESGRVTVLDEGFHLANGIGLSPAEDTIYVTDSAARLIFAYDYDIHSGEARRRRQFVRVPDEEGIPDGLAVDAEGFVWSVQWYGGCVVRYDPAGKEERRIEVPAKQTSSAGFGGPDLTELFITSAAKSEPMPVMPPGYDPSTGPFGGPLFRVNTRVQGMAQHPANIRSSTRGEHADR
jgi:D-xylonolactonase